MEGVKADGVLAPLPGSEHPQDKEQGSERCRVPCPLDPKHTVFQDSLEKHLKKCNSRAKPKPVYYVQDINAGPHVGEDLPADEIPLGERSKTELDLLIQKLYKAVNGLNSNHEERIYSHPALDDALTDPKNGNAACKHLKQQASLLGNMEALRLLGADRCFVEFGAGKGKLSHWIHVASQDCPNVHYVLVERSSIRFKVDGKHKNADSVFERLQVDIQHLCLRKVPFLREKHLPIVGVGKHLCGAATDLALRCLLESSVEKEEDSGTEDSQPPAKRAKRQGDAERGCPEEAAGEKEGARACGLAIALCCHHRCDWRNYVGQEFFQQRGLGAHEFAAFQRMSSWATCGLRNTGDAEDPSPPAGCDDDRWGAEEHERGGDAVPGGLDGLVSAEDRERVGRMCKLLIDSGRVHYLQRRGYASSLCYYTSKDVSLENVLLTAVPAAATG